MPKGGKQSRIDVDHTSDQLEEALKKSPDVLESNAMGALEMIFKVASIILETEGRPGWSDTIKGADGTSYVPSAQQGAFEEQLQPLVMGLLQIRDGSTNQSGGGMDELFESLQTFFDAADRKSIQFAKEYGIINYVQESYEQPDFKPFEGFQFIPYIGTNPVGVAISKIPVTVSFIIFVGYVSLEFLRNLTVVFGDAPRYRQILSIAMGVIEMLNGDWKSALLSLAGLVGPSGVYAGSFTKFLLNIFRLMPEAQQETVIDTSYTSAKSLLVGTGIKLFQLTAPYEVRIQVIEGLKEVSKQTFELDQALVQAGLPKRKDWYEPNWSDLNRIVTVVSDPARVCTDEFFNNISSLASQSVFLAFVLQIVGIPTSSATRDRVCVQLNKTIMKKGYGTMNEYFAGEGLGALLDEKLANIVPPPERVVPAPVIIPQTAAKRKEEQVAAAKGKEEEQDAAAEIKEKEQVAAAETKEEEQVAAAEIKEEEQVAAAETKQDAAAERKEEQVAATERKEEQVAAPAAPPPSAATIPISSQETVVPSPIVAQETAPQETARPPITAVGGSRSKKRRNLRYTKRRKTS